MKKINHIINFKLLLQSVLIAIIYLIKNDRVKIIKSKSNASIKLKISLAVLTILAIFSIIIFVMIIAFERIGLNAVNQLNTEFTFQIDNITSSIKENVDNLGKQIYFLNSIKKLRTCTNLKQNEKVFLLRDVWKYTTNNDMIQSIYVYNGDIDYIYTTDHEYMSDDIYKFYDRGIVDLLANRNNLNRNKLYFRQLPVKGSDRTIPVYSFLIYDVYPNNTISNSAVVLNLYRDWFLQYISKLSSYPFAILDYDGKILNSNLNNIDIHKDNLKNTKINSYSIKQTPKGKFVYYFSDLSTLSWRHIKILNKKDILPEVSFIKLLSFYVVLFLLFIILLVFVVYIKTTYVPYQKIKKNIKDLPDNILKDSTVDTINSIVYSNKKNALKLQLQEALLNRNQNILNTFSFPCVLMVFDTSDQEMLESFFLNTNFQFTSLIWDNNLIYLINTNDISAVLSNIYLNKKAYYSILTSESNIYEQYHKLLAIKQVKFLFKDNIIDDTKYHEDGDYKKISEEDINSFLLCIKNDGISIKNKFHALFSHCTFANLENLLVYFRLLDNILSEKTSIPPFTSHEIYLTLNQANNIEDLYKFFEEKLQSYQINYLKTKENAMANISDICIQFIKDNYKDYNLNSKLIAEHLKISPSYLRKQFLEYNGVSLHEYINDYRLSKVADLLKTTDMTIEQIASNVGFENYKYIYSKFKEKFGKTPSNYRKT